MAPLSATALEIGTPHGTPVLGSSLRLEFPIGLSGSDKLPASNCFYLAPRPDDADGDFFLKDMRFTLEKRGTGAMLIVKSPRGVSSPIIGFRVQVGCDVGISRDFMFFSSQREIVAPAKPVAAALAAETAAKASASASGSISGSGHSGMAEMTVARNTRLNWLARGLYPSSRPTRDEYRRLMKEANPELFGHATDRVGSVHIPAGTVLRIPPNLPKKEAPAKLSPSVAEAPLPALGPPVAVPQAKASRSDSARVETAPIGPAPARAAQKTDRLVIGSGQGRVPSLSGQGLRQTLERLEQRMTEKTESDIAMSETLTSLASSFGEVKTYLQGVDERIKRAEAGQLQAQTEIQGLREELRSSFSLVELLLAVVGGSIVGAGLIAFFQRRRTLSPPPPGTLQSPIPPAPPAPSVGGTSSAHGSGAAGTGTASATVKKTAPAAAPRAGAERADRVEPASGAAMTQPWEKAPATSRTSTAGAAASASAALPDHFSALKKTDAASPAGNEDPFASSIVAPAPEASSADKAPEFGFESPAIAMASPEIFAAETSASASATREPLEFRVDDVSGDDARTASNAPDTVEPELPRSFADPVLELADVMTSLGLAKEAASAVIEHIRQHPDQDPSHWFKVLEIYRNTGNREAFDAAAQELRQKLNVAVDDWAGDPGKQETSLEHYPHIAQNLQALWPRPECEAFLTKLLEDNRDGKRQGFPQAVAAEIVLLRAMLRNSLQIDFPPIGSAESAESAGSVTENKDNTGGLTLSNPFESPAPRESRLLP